MAKAIEQYLMSVTYQQALELSFGKWNDDDYPNLRTQEDMERFIREMRSDESWYLEQENGR